MINGVFKTLIEDHLSPYLVYKLNSPGPDGTWVVPCNVSDINDANEGLLKGRLIMSLVNIEEDRVYNVNENRQRQGSSLTSAYQKPPVYVNLYILFASYFDIGNDGDNYLQGLNLISLVLQFFQHQNVFTTANSPGLAAYNIEELIFDLRTLSFQDMNNLWGVLGAKYLPSALYKVRMLAINEQFAEGIVPIIQEVSMNDVTM